MSLSKYSDLVFYNSDLKSKYADNNHWLNIIQIDRKIYGMNRDSLMDKLEKEGLQTRPVWQLNHLQKQYKNYQRYRISNALDLLKKSINLPSSINLSEKQINTIIDIIIKSME